MDALKDAARVLSEVEDSWERKTVLLGRAQLRYSNALDAAFGPASRDERTERFRRQQFKAQIAMVSGNIHPCVDVGRARPSPAGCMSGFVKKDLAIWKVNAGLAKLPAIMDLPECMKETHMFTLVHLADGSKIVFNHELARYRLFLDARDYTEPEYDTSSEYEIYSTVGDFGGVATLVFWEAGVGLPTLEPVEDVPTYIR